MKAKFLVLSGLLFAAAPAFAQDATPPAGGDATPAAAPAAAPAATPAASSSTPGPATGAMPKLWIGGGLELAPQGSISGSSGPSVGTDTGVYGIDVMALYSVHPLIAVGLAPRYLLNITAGGSSQSASMYDIRAVGVVHKEVKPKINVMGLVGLGYSGISLPSMQGVSIPNPAGMTLSFGAGAAYSISPKLLGTASLQYELGFQSASAGGQSADFKFNYLSINLGVLFGAM